MTEQARRYKAALGGGEGTVWPIVIPDANGSLCYYSDLEAAHERIAALESENAALRTESSRRLEVLELQKQNSRTLGDSVARIVGLPVDKYDDGDALLGAVESLKAKVARLEAPVSDAEQMDSLYFESWTEAANLQKVCPTCKKMNGWPDCKDKWHLQMESSDGDNTLTKEPEGTLDWDFYAGPSPTRPSGTVIATIKRLKEPE